MDVLKIFAMVCFALIVFAGPVSAGRYVVNEDNSRYFHFKEAVSSTGPDYFVIKGGVGMDVWIYLKVSGTNVSNGKVHVYLIEGDYTLPAGETAPNKYDDWHSHPDSTKTFNTNFVMSIGHGTYTLLVVPDQSTSYTVEISGYNEESSFSSTVEVCMVVGLIALVVVLLVFRAWGVIGKPRPVKFRRKPEKKEEYSGDDTPYRIK